MAVCSPLNLAVSGGLYYDYKKFELGIKVSTCGNCDYWDFKIPILDPPPFRPLCLRGLVLYHHHTRTVYPLTVMEPTAMPPPTMHYYLGTGKYSLTTANKPASVCSQSELVRGPTLNRSNAALSYSTIVTTIMIIPRAFTPESFVYSIPLGTPVGYGDIMPIFSR